MATKTVKAVKAAKPAKKQSYAAKNALLILALVFPLGAANFLLNLVLTLLYIPALASFMTEGADTAVRIFLPFTLYLVGLAFSILVLTFKKGDTVAAVVALVLNAILVVSGFFFVYSAYFATAAGV